jgi:UDP-N-acetylglucosamine:LPS N-acetylglucosamine transferase
MLFLKEAFEKHDCFFITYSSARTESLGFRNYLMGNIGKNPLRMSKAFISVSGILIRERPDAILSTGSEIAIPAIIIGKLLGIRTVFIESWCRVRSRSFTGRVVYFFSDVFLVQWPQLCDAYGRKAKYAGSIQ